jgi:transcriptional regulator with PAS, ATPase and Fis domain
MQYSIIVNSQPEITPNNFQAEILGKSESSNFPFRENLVLDPATSPNQQLTNNLNLDMLSPTDNLSLKIATERLEAMWIREAFLRANTQEEASKLLGISRGALQYKIRNNQFLVDFNSGNL